MISEVKEIVKLQFERVRSRLFEQGMDAKLTDAAAELLAQHGYDPIFGARPVKRTIEMEVAQKIASMILTGQLQEGDVAVVDVEDGEIVVKK